MAIAHIQTTGVPFDSQAAGAALPQRRDIRDLINDRVSFSLYIQALARMYATNQDDDMSYYQIAGIHGLPFKAWQGSGGAGATQTGYCTHSNILFPTWHRPYLALYEQILCKHARDIADEANMPTAWKEAASNLRQPYWDWAANLTPPAEVLDLRNLSILQPDGTESDVVNPLYSYRFADPASSFADVDETFRGVDGITPAHGRQITRQTYSLLTRVNDWFGFSTSAANGISISSSLESIHDDLHGTIGGFMGAVPYAAFDPIFWMRFTSSIGRSPAFELKIFALWQVLHPSVWVTPSNMGSSSTWTIAANATVDARTPLTPFYDGPRADDYWTSAEVKMPSRFGYTYPELVAVANAANPALPLFQIVTDLYGSGSARSLALLAERFRLNDVVFPEVLRSAGVAAEAVDVKKTLPTVHAALGEDLMKGSAQMALGAMAPGLALQSFIAMPQAKAEEAKQAIFAAPTDKNETGLTDWSARVRVGKHVLNESFKVCIFLVPEGIENSTISETDSKGWYESDYFVGQFCAFVNGTHQDMWQDCVHQKEKHIVIEGHVPLDEAIIEISGLMSFDDKVVHPYLTKNLVWRCKKLDGTVVRMDQIPSLEVSVWSTKLKFDPRNTDAVLPDWTLPECHESITAGQAGGCKETTHGHNSTTM